MKTLEATAVTEIFPEGERVTALIVEYPQLVDGKSVSACSYELEGKRIVNAYVTSTKDTAEPTSEGLYVVLLLETSAASLMTLTSVDGHVARIIPSLILRQVKDITGKNGSLFAASEDVIPITLPQVSVQAFTEHEFFHSSLSEPLRYSLHIPCDSRSDRSYPLVLFIHDRGVVSKTERLGLIQGMGAVVWANREVQKEEPCYVVAVHYRRAIVNDAFEATEELEGTKQLLDFLIGRFPVDIRRIYGTGQSMGCMALMEMGIRYPNLFAGLLLVAGQWNPKQISKLGKVPFWAFVSQDDDRAYIGMSDCIQALQKEGFAVDSATWDGTMDLAILEEQAFKQAKKATHSLFTIFAGSSVVRPELCIENTLPRMLQNHIATWRVVYQLEAVQMWLFAQRKK